MHTQTRVYSTDVFAHTGTRKHLSVQVTHRQSHSPALINPSCMFAITHMVHVFWHHIYTFLGSKPETFKAQSPQPPVNSTKKTEQRKTNARTWAPLYPSTSKTTACGGKENIEETSASRKPDRFKFYFGGEYQFCRHTCGRRGRWQNAMTPQRDFQQQRCHW